MCSKIKCSPSTHFLLIIFICSTYFFIDGIKSRSLLFCVYECLNHAKKTFLTCVKTLFFVFFKIITKFTFLYSIIQKLMT
jgi:hypothetical protein